MKKNNGLNLIKIFAFITILLLHSEQILNINTNNLARLGVELFLIISGLLITINYYNKENDNFNSISFFKSKLKKIYPLLLVSIMVKAPVSLYKYYLEVNGNIINFLIVSILRLIPTVGLFQAYIPNENYYFAYNGVSWFLDILILGYLIAPIFIKIIKKISNKKIFILLFSILLFQVLFLALTDILNINDYWCYIFPLYRISDFIVGMLLGKIYLLIHEKKIYNNHLKNLSEILIVLLIILGYFFNCYNNDIICLLFSIIIIIVYSFSSGCITKSFTENIFFEKISTINFELYLLHQPLIKYFEFFLDKFSFSYVLNVIFYFIYLIVLLLVSFLYHYLFIDKKCKK